MPIRSQITRSSVRRSGTGGGGGGGGGTISDIIGTNGITVAAPTGPTTTIGQQNTAAWTIGNPRIYAVDGALGNDANVGFADAASNSAPDYAAAVTAAGAVAKKTVAGLAAIFPRFGAGRLVEVVFAAGTYAGSPADFLNGVTGYAAGGAIVRGTSTNATAGSVAFAGTVAEGTYVGAVTATGLNAAGYNPNGSITTSSIECTKVGGGAPAWGAEPALPFGLRIRFDNNAPTNAALHNQCRQVCQVAGTDTVLLQTVEPALPVGTDVFYTEQPGVVFSGVCNLDAPYSTGIVFVGIAFNTDLTLPSGRYRTVFCTIGGNYSSSTPDLITNSQFYTHPILGTITPGGGLRVTGTALINRGQHVAAGLTCALNITGSSMNPSSTIGAGCAARNILLLNWQGAQNENTNSNPNLGNSLAVNVGVPHTFGSNGGAGLRINGCDIAIGNFNVFGAGATPAVQILAKNTIVLAGVLGGSTGNTDVGMDFQNADGSVVSILATAAPTVTGTAGDVRWSGPAFGTWTQFQFQEQYDTAGNHIYQEVVNAEYDHTITPSVSLEVNNSGAPVNASSLVAHNGGSLQFQPAVAGNTVIGVLDHLTQNGEAALVGALSGFRIVNFLAAPALGNLVFVSATPGLATDVDPGNQAPIGVVVGNAFPGNIAMVQFGAASFAGGFGEDVSVIKNNAAATPKTILELIAAYTNNAAGIEATTWTMKVLQAGAQVAAQVVAGLGTLFPAGFYDGTPAHTVMGVAVGDVGTGMNKFVGGPSLAWAINGIEGLFFSKTGGGDGNVELDGTFANLTLGGDCQVTRSIDSGANQSNLSLIGKFAVAITDVVIGPNAANANNANGGFLQLPTCPGIPTGTPFLNTGKQAFIVANTGVAAQLYRWDGAAWHAGPLL